MSALVDSARKYLGVPFRHRGRSATGLDCAGLGWISYRDLGIELPDVRAYGREPFKNGLMEGLRAALGDPIDDGLQPGDVVVMRFDKDPHHVALIAKAPYADELTMIHADSMHGRVVEHRLSKDWRARIVAVYRRPV